MGSYKLFSTKGKIVVVDPWLTNDPYWPLSERGPEKLKEIDVIAITHAHFDHSSEIDENNIEHPMGSETT